MREIVLDTETTGLKPAEGHRIVEIGAIELFNHIPTGRTYPVYIDPQRDMPAEAAAVHGLTTDFLRGRPCFDAIVREFIEFLGDAPLIIHNASFDAAFLNAEFAACGHPAILPERLIDTLMLARQKHPMGPNSLDALCKRYGIDNSKRDKHGALLDAGLLADVYIELIGGRQAALTLAANPRQRRIGSEASGNRQVGRPRVLPERITAIELEAHAKLIGELGDQALWLRVRN
jgi:DNA polymerase-3 subunit epsilon